MNSRNESTQDSYDIYDALKLNYAQISRYRGNEKENVLVNKLIGTRTATTLTAHNKDYHREEK
jgi:hypothetical protein